MDQDSAFILSIMNYLFMKFNTKIKTVVPYNHQSLQAEHGIKSLSTMLTKHLTHFGQMWLKYLSLSTFAYNTFNTPNMFQVHLMLCIAVLGVNLKGCPGARCHKCRYIGAP